jgi:hypothetical protein
MEGISPPFFIRLAIVRKCDGDVISYAYFTKFATCQTQDSTQNYDKSRAL